MSLTIFATIAYNFASRAILILKIDWDGQRVDYFSEAYLGEWWGHLDPRDYCRAVWYLSEQILKIAWDEDVMSIWKKCADLKLELLRYNISDNQGIRDEIPSILLYRNKADDCFRFIKWEAYNYRYKYAKGYGNDNNVNPVWEEGVFVYNEAGGDRFDDVYPMINDNGDDIAGLDLKTFGVVYNANTASNSVNKNLNHLAALIVIKLRVVAHLETQRCVALKANPAADRYQRKDRNPKKATG